MELTREQAIAEHRKMWNWIADETERRGEKAEKIWYFIAHEFVGEVKNFCFCCEYCWQNSDRTPKCERCPIDWGGSRKTFQCCFKHNDSSYDGLYGLWSKALYPPKAAELARQIANLPESEAAER